LTCDALVSASVVLPGGDEVTAAPDDRSDLFWALRGGGGGSFGIVTSLTFRTFPPVDRDVVTLTFPPEAAAQVLQGWQDWLRSADRTIWGMVNITVGPSPGRCLVVLATPAGAGPSRVRDLGAAIGVTPASTTTRTLNRMDFIRYFEGGADATRARAFVAGSDIIEDITETAVASIIAATSTWPQAAGSATAVIEPLSGAVADVDPAATAFPWRRQAACVQWYTEPPTPAKVDLANQWLTTAHQAVQENSAGRYVNYIESDTPAQEYFGGNLARLAAARQKYDPDGVLYSGLRL
jgi:FAD/FMN-containing dehydrogenase